MVNFAAWQCFVPLIPLIGRKHDTPSPPDDSNTMATDSTFNETDNAPEETRDEAGPMRTPNPPRPPRPVKRSSKASGRIPMPSPPSEPSFSIESEHDLSEAAPGVSIDDDRDEPAIPLMAARAKPHSVRPEESFADLDDDLSDHAPPAPFSDRVPPAPIVNKRPAPAQFSHRSPPVQLSHRAPPAPSAPPSDRAPSTGFSDQAPPAPFSDRAPPAPLTPRHTMPSRQHDPSERTPPRGAVKVSRGYDRDEEPEPTIVGKVPDNLLELSSSGSDENTRAFTAPRELIELAKRKREESRASRAPSDEHLRDTPRPAAPIVMDAHASYAPPTPVDEGPEPHDAPAAPAVTAESLAPPGSDEDAAPPVARTVSGEMEAVALPSRRRPDSDPPESDPPEPSGPDIEVGPGSELSDPGVAVSGVPSAPVSRSASEPLPSSVVKASPKRWLVMAVVFVVVGMLIARWREIAVFMHMRH